MVTEEGLHTDSPPEIVTKEVAEKILELQNRCINCGSAYNLHIHHRLFRSEGEFGVSSFLQKALKVYRACYGRMLQPWFLHSIQNLCVLCQECHEWPKKGVHGGNEALRRMLRNSFTDPITGLNTPYYKPKNVAN